MTPEEHPDLGALADELEKASETTCVTPFVVSQFMFAQFGMRRAARALRWAEVSPFNQTKGDE